MSGRFGTISIDNKGYFLFFVHIIYYPIYNKKRLQVSTQLKNLNL